GLLRAATATAAVFLTWLARRTLIVATTTAAAIATTTEHLHLVGHDVGVVALLTIIAGRFAVGDAAFHVDLRTLAQVLAGDLAELAEECHAVPFGLFLVVAITILADRGGGQAGFGDGHAALRVP